MLKKQYWPAILWALFILIICGIPGNQIPKLKFGLDLFADKVVHIFIFGILTALILWKGHKKGILNKSAVAIAIVITSLYGALIEVLQATIFINRSGDVNDWIADTAGAVLAWLVLKGLKNKRAA